MAYTIKKKHGSYNRSIKTGSYKYIVCHYTGSGTSSSGSAKANCIYFSGGNRNASAHYFIDNANIYEYADPSKYFTWHCGDGYGKYGITNANSIGIEVCLNGDKPYTNKEIARLTWLVQHLQEKYGIKDANVVRHYDASRKFCPYYYATRSAKWKVLHKKLVGDITTTKKTSAKTTSYKVKIDTNVLRVRNGAGTNYKVNTTVKKGDIYTIVQEKNGWGKLKSGAGWIKLSYTEKV